MKKFLTTTVLLAIFATCTTTMAQTRQDEYLGLPGDNLNLYAVMKLFQGSETLEGFERNLNDENYRINNLDLNGDNRVDYIRVVDYVDRDVHNIVLQVAINKRENQDVAVFTVQRFSNGQVQIQLIGDEALYGKNYIIEPIYDEQYAGQTPNPGYTGNTAWNVPVVRTTYYEIAAWPVIRFIYMPGYIAWHSSWYWGYYPSYWNPWTPYYWHFYYGYHYNNYNIYYSHYHRCDYTRYSHWNDFYYHGKRSHSHYVSHRIESGHYRTTYSHPEQRSKGEALYTRTNTGQSNRRADPALGNNKGERADSRTNQNRQQQGNSFSTSRRTATTATRATSAPKTGQNENFARRSATTTSVRKPANTVNKQTTGSVKRTNATATARTSTQHTTPYNSFSERRSATTVSDRSAAKPKPVQNSAINRSHSKPAAAAASSPGRRSSGSSTSVKASKSNESRSTSDPAKTTRRK